MSVSALSLMGLNFIKAFGFMGLPIFVSLAACNEVGLATSTISLIALLALLQNIGSDKYMREDS